MRAEQISVFLENKAGRLCEVTGILAEAQVNIRALALADTSDFGVLRLIVDDTEKAKEALKKAGFTVGKTNVLAVEVPDRPGGLYGILNLLQASGSDADDHHSHINEIDPVKLLVPLHRACKHIPKTRILYHAI